MTINQIAIVIFVVPELKLFQKFAIEGNKYPEPTPIAIARNIH